MKAIVDRETCIGCGLCISGCPEVFDSDEDGKAKVIAAEVPDGAKEQCRGAAKDCPVEAIKIQE